MRRVASMVAALAAYAMGTQALAATTVPAGNLSGSVTWTAAGSPYVLSGDVTVISSASLVIEAGVTVQFQQGDTLGSGQDTARTELRIEGSLETRGTAANPVTFTSARSSPATSDYYGVVVRPGGNANLAGAVFRYGERCLFSDGAASLTVTGGAAQSCRYGVYVSGGAPTVSGMELANNTTYGLYISAAAGMNASGLRVHHNTSYGIYVENATCTISGSLIHDNGGRGVYITQSGSSGKTVTLRNNTIVGHSSYGVYATGSYNGNLTVNAVDNIVVHNGSYGLYNANGYASFTASYNLVWGHTSDTGYYSVSQGAGSMSENPLFVNEAGRDLRITSNSPARLHASNGGDIGALPYDGAPTPFLAGHLYANTTLTAAGSPHQVTGDLTVEPGVTLTLEPGATLSFASNSDVMGGGMAADKTELRVAGILLASGTSASRIHLRTGAGAGTWQGVLLLAGSGPSMLDQLIVEDAMRGIESQAANDTSVRNTILMGNQEYGLSVIAGAASFAGLTVRNNRSYGIYVSNASPTITSSVIFDNGSRGVYITQSGSSGKTVTLRNNTIVGHSGYGVYASGSYSGNLTVNAVDNIVVHNGSFGLYNANGYASFTASYNLVWGHTSDTGYDSVSLGAGSMSENPLFVNEAGRDLRITSNSPARLHASNGGDIGALPYDGAPTPFLAGHLYANTTLTAAGSPHQVTGDLTVEPGVTLTLAPGAVVRFAANSDVMGGNADASKTELRVLGALNADGTASSNIVLESNAGSPARGDWDGVYLLSPTTASFFDYVTVRHATSCVTSKAGSNTAFQRSIAEQCQQYGLNIDAGALQVTESIVRNNASYGIYVANASPTIATSLIYDNGSRGVYITQSGSSGKTVTLRNNTIVGHSGYGVYASGSYSGNLTVNAVDNIVVHNGSFGLYNANGYASFTASYNLVWGHTSDTGYDSVSLGAGSMSENPLFVNEAGRDLRITSNSPARLHASNGGDIGALAYAGHPTVGLQGHLYDNATWGAGTHQVLGDITVEPGVTLTVEAGADVRMAADTDSMGGNENAGRTELRVLGRLVVAGTAANPVRFGSSAAAPGGDDWHGIRLLPSAANSAIAQAIISHANIGIVSEADATNLVSGGEITGCQQYGISVTGGAAVFDGVKVHGNGSYGVYVSNASPDLINLVVFANAGRGIHVTASGSTARTVDILNCTVANNAGYGLYLSGSYGGNLTVNLRNNIVASNGNYGVYNYIGYATVNASYNDVWDHSSGPYYSVSAGAGSISANPLFVDSAAGNYHLLASSPCIDAGQAQAAVTRDADGLNRPIDGNSSGTAETDIGAYEFNPSANKWPIADAGPDRVVESGKPATFSGAGSYDPDGTIVSYAWDFGDGSTGSGVTVTHTFSGGTDRVVTLTVTDNDGATATDTVNVEVNLPPVADAGPDKHEDVGVTVSFSGAGSSDPDGTIALYHWDFGDGSVATGLGVSHQYQSAGTYTVTLTVTDDDGATDTDTTTAYILGTVDQTAPSIVHSPVANNQPEGQAVTVSATVTDASGVAAVNLHYRTEGAASYASVAMVKGSGDLWSAAIPAGTVALPAVQYYIEATDTASPPNRATNPAGAPASAHRFTVADRTAPLIAHTPISDGQPQGQAVSILATVTDSSPLGAVTLHYRVRGTSTFATAVMTSTGGSAYSAQIPASSVNLPAVEYYLSAADTASPANSGTSPAGAPGSVYAFTVVDRTAPSITHAPVSGSKPEGQAVALSASVTDNVGVASVTLHYRVKGTANFSSVALSGSSGSYSGSIPAAAVLPPAVEYYLEAKDQANNAAVHPAGAPASVHEFQVTGADRTPPAIVHVPVADGKVAGQAVAIEATVTDPSGVASVVLYYRKQGTASFANLAMSSGGGSLYSASIPAAAVQEPGMEYYLKATDASSQANEGFEPSGAPATLLAFSVVAADNTPPTITHTPVANGQPEGQPVPIAATISDPSGIASAILHYRAKGASAFASVAMTSAGGDDYAATIPAATVTQAGVDYYILATDNRSNTAGSPASAPATWHSFTVQRPITIAPGDLVITEIMANPTGTETQREWFEVYNTTSQPIDLQGLVFADEGTDDFTVTGSAVVAPHAYFVLGRSADTSVNGGVPVDYVYSGFSLANTEDEVVILAGSTVIDRVAYNSSDFPRTEGHSMSLDPTALDYVENDDGAQWCSASTPLSGGDYGTPGAPNDSCAPPPDTEPPAIAHTPIGNGQPAGMPVSIGAVVTDASGVASVTLWFRRAGDSVFTEEPMFRTTGDTWQGEIPGSSVTTAGVEYYLVAVDAAPAANRATSPAGGSSAPYSFTVVQTDASGPAITHQAITGPVAPGAAIAVQATVTDPSGVASVRLYFKPASGAWTSVALAQSAPDTYAGEIPFPAVVAPSVSYYLEATDASAASNVSRLPEQGQAAPFVVAVEAGDEVGPVIVHQPIANGQPAAADVTVTATVTDASGVAEVRVYFRPAGSGTFQSQELTSAGGASYTGKIPAAAVAAPAVDYYLEAVDESEAQNLTREPSNAPVGFFTFTVIAGADTTGPAIEHTPVAGEVPAGEPVRIEAQISDPSGIAIATLRYRVAGTSAFRTLALVDEGSAWAATIPGEDVTEDGVEYYLEAIDLATMPNVATSPAGAPAELHSISVAGGEPVDPGSNPLAPTEDGCGCGASGGGVAMSLLGLMGLAGLLPRRRRRG